MFGEAIKSFLYLQLENLGKTGLGYRDFPEPAEKNNNTGEYVDSISGQNRLPCTAVQLHCLQRGTSAPHTNQNTVSGELCASLLTYKFRVTSDHTQIVQRERDEDMNSESSHVP